MWKKHPKALPFLFFSEMWERFGYYLMIGIFTLYLEEGTQGFAMSKEESASLYGTFIGLVFFTPFIGGLLADRLLGYRLPIVIGGIMMGIVEHVHTGPSRLWENHFDALEFRWSTRLGQEEHARAG